MDRGSYEPLSETDKLQKAVMDANTELRRAQLRLERHQLWLRLDALNQEKGEIESRLAEIRLREAR